MASILAEIEALRRNGVYDDDRSDGSDVDVGNFSDSDDFTLDGGRCVDAINREIAHIEREEALQLQVNNPVLNGEPPQPAVHVPPVPAVDLNVAPQWQADNFSSREELECTLDGGAKVDVPEGAQAKDFFNLFWTNLWWDHLVTETNRYAADQGANDKWSPVDLTDMKVFIGLMLAMGILQSNVLKDYWRQTKRLFITQFGKVMARDRFLMIWRYLHLADNAAPDAHGENRDKLAKLRPMITAMNRKFKDNYTPYKNVSVDESMVKFKGRLAFRQYLPAKPTKWGIKIWAMSESSTGYMSSFQVYTGKEAGQEHGLAHRVVTDLVRPYHHTGMRVYMDNFYTSVPLLRELASLGIGGCGTVRANRKYLPTELLPKRVQLMKHEYKCAQSDNLSFCVWQDTKAVCVLSNFHDPSHRGMVNRRLGGQQQQAVEVPLALSDYQKCMMGVDLTDQMIGYYMQNHRTRKWWRRVFVYLTMVSAHNAYVLAKDASPDFAKKSWPGFKAFLEDLTEDLTFGAKANRQPPILHQPRQGNEHHTLVKRADGLKKVCAECQIQGQTGLTSKHMYRICEVAVHVKCLQAHQQRMMQQ